MQGAGVGRVSTANRATSLREARSQPVVERSPGGDGPDRCPCVALTKYGKKSVGHGPPGTSLGSKRSLASGKPRRAPAGPARLLRRVLARAVRRHLERREYSRFRINFESTKLPDPCRGCGLMWSL